VADLNVSAHRGGIPWSRHTRATVPEPTSKCWANSRELQCVTPYFFGGGAVHDACGFVAGPVFITVCREMEYRRATAAHEFAIQPNSTARQLQARSI
jgi:hypothetical protein